MKITVESPSSQPNIPPFPGHYQSTQTGQVILAFDNYSGVVVETSNHQLASPVGCFKTDWHDFRSSNWTRIYRTSHFADQI